jgi:hypothetical protein
MYLNVTIFQHFCITAKEIFKLHPEGKEQLWGGEFWTKGYLNTHPGTFFF